MLHHLVDRVAHHLVDNLEEVLAAARYFLKKIKFDALRTKPIRNSREFVRLPGGGIGGVSVGNDPPGCGGRPGGSGFHSPGGAGGNGPWVGS